jgi:hypothetical protein
MVWYLERWLHIKQFVEMVSWRVLFEICCFFVRRLRMYLLYVSETEKEQRRLVYIRTAC